MRKFEEAKRKEEEKRAYDADIKNKYDAIMERKRKNPEQFRGWEGLGEDVQVFGVGSAYSVKKDKNGKITEVHRTMTK